MIRWVHPCSLAASTGQHAAAKYIVRHTSNAPGSIYSYIYTFVYTDTYIDVWLS